MKATERFHKYVVAARLVSGGPQSLALGLALSLVIALSQPAAAADAAKLDDLYSRLQSADPEAAARIETEIGIESARSGSAALDLLLRRGREALAAGDIAAATDHLSAALDHAPDFTEARANRAIAFFRSGETGPALADLAQVLTEEPRHFMAWSLLGTILEETDQPGRALAAYQRAANSHPHIPEVNGAIARLEQDLEGKAL